MAIFAVKYRDDTGHEGRRADSPARSRSSSAWSLIPFVIAIGIFAYATVVYFELVRPPAETLRDLLHRQALDVALPAHQTASAEINELHVPMGRPVKVTFTSEDVLHDLYIPAFRVKADAIPGRYSAIWFDADADRHVPPVLRRVLRHPALRHDRHGWS